MGKTNVRLIPKSVRAQLQKFAGKPVIAACSRVYSAAEIGSGALKQLGIGIADGRVTHPASILPPEDQGKYSSRNIYGEEIVRRDLKMETIYTPIETPNWGDSANGTHTVWLPHERYPRDLISPRLAEIKIKVPQSQDPQGNHLIIFEVDQVLDQSSPSFEKDLLACLNLLQENVGTCGIQPSDVSVTDYLKTVKVAWEVLPPGTREEAMSRVFRGKTPSEELRKAVEERYAFLMSLKPEKLVFGASGLERYFGALIKDDLVVFENIQYGNAIYIMFENWKELSQRTRTELLSGRFGKNFERIKHGSGWKERVREILRKKKSGR